MELTDQKITEIKITICNYFDVDYKLLDQFSRKPPIPYLKKMVCYFSSVYLKIQQQVIGDYFGMKHSNVSIHVKSFKNYLEVNQRLKKEIAEIELILSEKGLINIGDKKSKYFSFVDLDNTILATKNDKQILFVGQSLVEIKTLLNDPEWNYEIHERTGKIFYSKINKKL